ncbi:MAG: CHASE3 domain-containing protein, partial [Nitrospiraceae bacterium]
MIRRGLAWWNRLRVQHKVGTVLFLLFLPLLCALAVHVSLIDKLLTIELQRHQTILAREQTHILRRLSVDIEDAFRGYLLTEQPAFLKPLEEAQAKVKPAIERLTNLAGSVPGFQNDIENAERQLTAFLSSKKRVLLEQFQAGK